MATVRATVASFLGAAVILSTTWSDAAPSWYAQARLAEGVNPADGLATCVAVRGDVAVIGAPGAVVGLGNVGVVRVYVRARTGWMLTQTVSPPPPASPRLDTFGDACALSDERLVVGNTGRSSSPGAAYVYLRGPSGFSLEQRLIPSDSSGGDNFGRSVAIAGATIVVGANRNSPLLEGGAYVFTRTGTTWSFVQKIAPTDLSESGRTMALEGSTLVVSAFDRTGARGVVRTYERAADTFTPTATLMSNLAATEDTFGLSVALSGDTLVVGEATAAEGRGRAVVYRRDAGGWAISKTLAPPSLIADDGFGAAVALSEGTFFVGASRRSGTGSAFVFDNGASGPGRELVLPAGLRAGARFGTSMGVSGDVLVLGAPQNDNAAGRADVFRRGLGPGDTCVEGSACVSGFCADGVCCNQACGGSNPRDCQACSRSAGAAIDGTCGPAAPTVVCRPALSTCDEAEHCDGVATACPADAVALNGSACLGGRCVVGRCTPGNGADATAAQAETSRPSPMACGCRTACKGGASTNEIGLPFGGFVLALILALGRRARRGGKAIAAIVACASGMCVTRTAHAGLAWREQSHLVPSPQANNQTGKCVAVRGDVAIVAAFLEDLGGAGGTILDRGSVFVYRRSGSTWVLAQTIVPPAGSAGYFGTSCAMSSDRLVIGEADAAYVYKLSGASWVVEQKLTAADFVPGDRFGSAVAANGDRILVSAPSRDGERGAVYTFVLGAAGWAAGPILTLPGAAAGTIFGTRLAFDGTTLAVTSPPGRGAVYAYARTSGWGPPQNLVAAAATAQDSFGTSVAVLGDLLVGSTQGASKPGSAVVFRRTGNTWTEQATLAPSTLVDRDRFGAAIAIEGTSVLVGAWGHDRGSVFAFAPSGATWSLLAELVSSNPDPLAGFFGSALSISGDTLFIGAPGRSAAKPGEAYSFRFSLGTGDACAAAAPCLSGFCVDGVCCGDACGGDKLARCSVCSRAVGAKTDGVCGPAPSSVECRKSASSCDVTERCDGISSTCPADAVVANGTACAAGVCLGGRCEPPNKPPATVDAGKSTPEGADDSGGCGCRATNRADVGIGGGLLVALVVGAFVRGARRRSGD